MPTDLRQMYNLLSGSSGGCDDWKSCSILQVSDMMYRFAADVAAER
jgi:hypothetical protein